MAEPDAAMAPRFYGLRAGFERVVVAHTLVPCGPIWLGDNNSAMKRVIERPDG
jgi:multimeric flavodoxin WrbA